MKNNLIRFVTALAVISLMLVLGGCTTFKVCPSVGGIPDPIVFENNTVVNVKKLGDHYEASERIFERIR